MKSHTRLLISLLLISTIANTTGCSKINETDGKVTEPNVFECEQIKHTIINNTVVEFVPTTPIEDAVIKRSAN